MQNGAEIWLFVHNSKTILSASGYELRLNGLIADKLGETMSTTLVFTIHSHPYSQAPGAVPRHVSMLIMIGHSLNRRGMEQPAEKALE